MIFCMNFDKQYLFKPAIHKSKTTHSEYQPLGIHYSSKTQHKISWNCYWLSPFEVPREYRKARAGPQSILDNSCDLREMLIVIKISQGAQHFSKNHTERDSCFKHGIFEHSSAVFRLISTTGNIALFRLEENCCIGNLSSHNEGKSYFTSLLLIVLMSYIP